MVSNNDVYAIAGGTFMYVYLLLFVHLLVRPIFAPSLFHSGYNKKLRAYEHILVRIREFTDLYLILLHLVGTYTHTITNNSFIRDINPLPLPLRCIFENMCKLCMTPRVRSRTYLNSFLTYYFCICCIAREIFPLNTHRIHGHVSINFTARFCSTSRFTRNHFFFSFTLFYRITVFRKNTTNSER